MKISVKDGWDRFLLYLPLTVMALLALGTYWLVRSTPTVQVAEKAAEVRHEPDYFLRTFSIKTFDATGRIRSEVWGDAARHYPDTQWMEIDAIRMRSVDAQGRVTTASAAKGLTNSDNSQVQLIGNAVVVREAVTAKGAAAAPRAEYRGEYLHAYLDADKVTSDKPVVLLRGQDRFTANSLDYDNTQRVLQLQGRVRGVLVPTKR